MDEETVRAIALAVAREMAGRGAASDPTVSDLIDRYERSPEFASLRAAKTERARHKHLRRLLGDRRVSELNDGVLDDYRSTRAREPGHVRGDGTGTPTAPATRNREVDRLCRVLNWAVERGHIAKNPIAQHADEPEPPGRRTSVTSDDVDRLRAAALDYGRDTRIGLTLRAMISTKFDAFLRRSELCDLRWSQLDFKAGAILLDLSQTKAHREGTRITILSDRAASDIRAAPRYVGAPWVFCSTRGARYNDRTFLRMLQEVAARAGVIGADGERFVAHDLRAGGASEQLELGTPERDLMDMAGWTTREMIDRYHRRRGAGAAARAKERLEKARRG